MLAFLHPCGRTLSRDHIVEALLLGAVAGTLITLGVLVVLSLGEGQALPGFIFWLSALPFAATGWVVGLVLVGAPAWYVMHRLRLRCWSAAMGLGAGILYLLAIVFEAGPLWAFIPAAIGAAVGYVIWSIAYRKAAQ